MPIEPLPVNRAPELVFGLVAPIGVDLDVAAEVLNVTLREVRYEAHVVRVTNLMRAIGVNLSFVPGIDPMSLLTEQPMNQSAAWYMVRRRAAAAGIAAPIGNHTFRATGITNFLENGGTLEHAQDMAAHASPRTTRLYDRRKERITQAQVERIRL
jgi:integrase